ncbi:hypothetical protein KSF73_11505 [Burkholderiaceae bacterium DAT-1]|nr:hypothetical protein [Burkholderiaceae bacterium DAT-1]
MVSIQAEGGNVVMEPHLVLGGACIFTAFDPHGAPFALMGENKCDTVTAFCPTVSLIQASTQ